MSTRLTRLFVAIMILAVLALSLPQSVGAAALPSMHIISVKADDSVTIGATGFPANINFTVRMDVAGKLAVNGIVVKEYNSGKGGSFEATYTIPDELKGKKTIAIRIESAEGYYCYDWFNNKTQTLPSATATPAPSSSTTGGIPSLVVSGVVKNKQITVEAKNLAADTSFSVRVGPYYNFSKQGVVTQTFNSGKGGKVVFNVNLPDVVKDVSLVAIRIDGGGHFAYNAFTNETSGTLSGDTTTPAGYSCSIISTTPSSALDKKGDFDAVWEIKNTGSKDWSSDSVDYKYMSGTKMHKFNAVYDLPKTVKTGETIKITVDMVAPDTAGWYTTNWAVSMGSSTLCSLPLTIRAK